MTEYQLREKLQNEFELEEWKQVLETCFPEIGFNEPVHDIQFDREEQHRLAEHIHNIGEVELDETKLVFIDVKLKEDATQLTRNRVGLRKLVNSDVIKDVEGAAIIVYHQPDYDEWRISFYSEQYRWDEDEGIVKEETNPNRYTFVVGGNETCLTPAQRLHTLIEKSASVTLKDVMEAFSVEKVSKRFFKEYKHQYDKFVSHLTGKVWTKNGEVEVGKGIGSQFNFFFQATSDHEKEARDFVKKLLGRIVFLYFVQKKGWLGASSDDFTDGSQKFIRELFNQVNNHSDPDQFYSIWLRKLFFEGLNDKEDFSFEMPDGSTCYMPFLNGGLFDRDDTDRNTKGLPIPGTFFSNPEFNERAEDKYDRRNKRGFLDFLDAFNFTIHEDSPGDHTIAVDPEMLGHIFENLLEDNKEKGAYYTPKPIVHYMCQESIIEYLNSKLDGDEKLRDNLEGLVKDEETGGINHLLEEILVALREVKVCDPAIGSGAFPMGILHEIYQVVENIDFVSHDDVKVTWGIEEINRDRAKIKRQIIQNSIYGVDIEQGAVDIARLRFWLSLIVDEQEPTPLPNLEYKIRTGNSLLSTVSFDGEDEPIEIDWEVDASSGGLWGQDEIAKKQEILEEIHEKQDLFFNSEKIDKEELGFKIRNLKIDLLINQLQLMIKTQGVEEKPRGSGNRFKQRMETYLKTEEWKQTVEKLKNLKQEPDAPFEHFEWELDFPEILNPFIAGDNAGFDIIIANPPYLGESGNKETFRAVRKGHLSEFYMGKMDYFYFFLHLALNLAVDKATVTFITTNYYPTADGAENLRNDLKERSRFLKLVNFNELKIFDSARGQHNMISILKKGTDDSLDVEVIETQRRGYISQQQIEKILRKKDEETIYRKFKSIDLFDGDKNYIRLIGTAEDSDNDINIILNRIKDRESELLGDLCNISQGVVSGCDTLTNRHIDKLSDRSSVQLGDGIFVFDLTNQRDRKAISKFNKEEKKLLKPFFKNSEIGKFSCNKEHSKLLLYLDRNVDSIDEYPNIKSHLNKFREILNDRREVRKGKINYFELQWPRKKEIFEGDKICVPYRVQDNCFAFNSTEWFCRSDCYLITNNRQSKTFKYLLAILNSSLFFFWLYYKGKRKGEVLELFYTPLSEIPIYLPSDDVQNQLINLVEEIEKFKQEGKPTRNLEFQLDLAVFELYDLTFNEASHVMDKKDVELSKEEFSAFDFNDLNYQEV